jgi:hypothetical protein
LEDADIPVWLLDGLQFDFALALFVLFAQRHWEPNIGSVEVVIVSAVDLIIDLVQFKLNVCF